MVCRLFGYVRPLEPQLRVCELEAYKAVYCGLCRQLGRTFGLPARFALSYDGTFLALLAMALAEPEPGIAPGRCPFHPLERRSLCGETPGLALAANVVALSLHWKLRDDLADEDLPRRLLARSGLLMTRGGYRRAAARHPELDAALAGMTRAQAALEGENCPDLDRAAEPTASLYSTLLASLAPEEESQRRVLARLGYLLGRYIYLADALDDLDKDRQKGRYNPLAAACGAGAETQAVRERGRGSLFLTIGETERTYRLLRVRRFSPILENILTLGLMSTAERLASAPAGRKGAETDG